VLLHEIGHLRHGDVLVVGVGSLFEAVVKRWMLIVVVSFLLPTLVVAVDQMIRFGRESAALGVVASDIVTHELVQWVTLVLPGLFARGLALLLGTASMFLLPLGAIWLSELGADRFASDTTGSSDGLLRAMDRLTVRAPWWRWLLLRMSHPPNWLRRHVARHGERRTVVAVVLLLYPLAYLARLIVLLAYNTINLLVAGASVSHLADVLARGIGTYTDTVTPVWLAMTACVLLWPLAAAQWERVFSGARSAGRVVRLPVYCASAIGLMVLLGIGHLLGLLVQP
jgi:hypothetical protein